jgi:lipoprotein-releasing system ATP-binding protein
MSNGTRTKSRSGADSGERLQGPHFSVVAGQRDLTRSVAQGRQMMHAKQLRKSYRKGQVAVPVLRGVDVEARDGEFMSVVGVSGSGKSTLLHLLATLDAPDSGEIHFDGCRIDTLAAVKRDEIRNSQIGVVFQFYHLLPEFTTLENVVLPSMIGCPVFSYLRKRRECLGRAQDLLQQVGLSHRLKHRPSELSGGEMQRVAIARALMRRPKVLLADEPTGNLDRQTGVQIMELLRSLNADQKLTIVMVTHDMSLAQQSDRVVQLVEGRVRDV